MSTSENMFVRQVMVIDLASSSDEGYTNESDNIHDLGDICYRTTFCSVLQEKIKSVLLESDSQEVYHPRSRQSYGEIQTTVMSACDSSGKRTNITRYIEKLLRFNIISSKQLEGCRATFKTFPSNAIMAEIGVDEGGYCSRLHSSHR